MFVNAVEAKFWENFIEKKMHIPCNSLLWILTGIYLIKFPEKNELKSIKIDCLVPKCTQSVIKI